MSIGRHLGWTEYGSVSLLIGDSISRTVQGPSFPPEPSRSVPWYPIPTGFHSLGHASQAVGQLCANCCRTMTVTVYKVQEEGKNKQLIADYYSRFAYLY